MAFKDGAFSATLIDNSRNGDFRFINVGAYTSAQLSANPPAIIGSEGEFTFCTTLGRLSFWVDGSGWDV
tara:strand:- start:391 stop:597 length:207 start_codon:yes stop_codon:yes gene_type:complete